MFPRYSRVLSSSTYRSESSSGSGVLTALLKVRANVNHQLRSLSCRYLWFALGAEVFRLMPSPAPVDAGSGDFSEWEVDGPKRPGTEDDDIFFGCKRARFKTLMFRDRVKIGRS